MGRQKKEKVNPRDTGGKAEEGEGEPQRYRWEGRRRR